MGLVRRLFGSGKDKKPAKRDVPPGDAKSTESVAPDASADVAALSTKELIRLLGLASSKTRLVAVAKLAEAGDRAAMRPLMNAYVNYGDASVLDALAHYGSDLSLTALREAADPGLIGERRARMMDILGVTGDETAAIAVRENVDPERNEPLVHTRACVALARLGDTRGIDLLAHDLELPDQELRTMALAALRQLDLPQANQAVTDHVNRYLSAAGAIPAQIEISAPRLDDPSTSVSIYICNHIKSTPHTLTVVVGSGAIKMARTRQSDIRRELSDHEVEFATVRLPPEERIRIVVAARDAAADDPQTRRVVIGTIPGPKASPPLPHILAKPDGPPFSAKVLFADPHECGNVMEWWHYVDDRAEVPTDFEVVLAISRPDGSAISEEEYIVWQLTPPERKRDFLRAFLARL